MQKNANKTLYSADLVLSSKFCYVYKQISYCYENLFLRIVVAEV